MTNIFQPVGESEVTRAIVSEFCQEFLDNVKSDVIIVGGGPSGLYAARELAKNKVKVIIIESNNYLGGGYWAGGYLMNKLTIREPGQKILTELGIPYKEFQPGLFVADAPDACAKTISAAYDAGAKILTCTKFEDVILRKGRVVGTVINWYAAGLLPRGIHCVDPVAIESKLVIDSSGHDAIVAKSLAKGNLLQVKGIQPMDLETSEDLVVENTKEIFPGLIATGMAVAEVFGLPRMGPTFSSMLLSGKKAAQLALELL